MHGSNDDAGDDPCDVVNVKMNEVVELRYRGFVEWGRKNGVVWRGVTLPAAFGRLGLVGVAAEEDLPASTVILAVPKKLIITPDHAYRIPQLKPVIAKLEPHIQKKDKDDHDFKMLLLFFVYQRLKGQSFFQPYFDSLPTQGFNILEWRNKYQELLEFLHYDREIDALKKEMDDVFEVAYEVFEEVGVLKALGCGKERMREVYWWAEYCLMTRSFGWSMPSTCMIPFVDLLNHFDNQDITHFILDLKQQLGPKTSDSYEVKHHTIDCTILHAIKDKPTKTLYNKYEKYCKQHKLMLLPNRSQAKQQVHKHTFHQLKAQKLDLRSLTFLDSSCTQDNDSQQEQKQLHEKIVNKIRSQQIKRLKQKDKGNQIIISIERKVCRFEDDGYEDQEEKSWSAYSQESYLITSTMRSVRKGRQLKYSYGKRNNKFLLAYYGFALRKNKYDSYAFRMTMDYFNEKVPLSRIPQQILFFESPKCDQTYFEYRGRKCISKQLSQQIRIKSQVFCQQLFIFLRVFLLPYFTKDEKEPMAMYPTSIAYQQFIMQFYGYILAFLRKRLPECPVQANNPVLQSICNLINNYHNIIDSQQSMLKSGVELLLMLKNKIPLKQAILNLDSQTCIKLTPYIKNLAATEVLLH